MKTPKTAAGEVCSAVESEPQAAEAALISGNLAARLKPRPFKEAPGRVFPQPVKACPDTSKSSSKILDAFRDGNREPGFPQPLKGLRPTMRPNQIFPQPLEGVHSMMKSNRSYPVGSQMHALHDQNQIGSFWQSDFFRSLSKARHRKYRIQFLPQPDGQNRGHYSTSEADSSHDLMGCCLIC